MVRRLGLLMGETGASAASNTPLATPGTAGSAAGAVGAGAGPSGASAGSTSGSTLVLSLEVDDELRLKLVDGGFAVLKEPPTQTPAACSQLCTVVQHYAALQAAAAVSADAFPDLAASTPDITDEVLDLDPAELTTRTRRHTPLVWAALEGAVAQTKAEDKGRRPPAPRRRCFPSCSNCKGGAQQSGWCLRTTWGC